MARRRGWGLVADDWPGGTHTSRTVMLRELQALLQACPAWAAADDYDRAVLEQNVLGKLSENTRRRSLRYLRELYILDRRSLLFRALRELWDLEPDARRLLGMVCALARDPLLRSTASVVLPASRGSELDAADLAQAVEASFPQAYSDAVRTKIGRNAASSWTQSGHLKGHSRKTRSQADASPASTVYALMIGHLSGARGHGLFSTVWSEALDAPPAQLFTYAETAASRGWLEFRRAGDVIEVGFRWLLRPVEENE